MKSFRFTCFKLGRVLLISALMSSSLVTSAVGEALVLHRHGVGRAHLHVLGSGDLLSEAAVSSKFGHCLRSVSALRSASQRVRTLAIVATGSVFVSTPRDAGVDEAGQPSHRNLPPFSVAEPQHAATVDLSTFRFPVRMGRTASAIILLRNHTLLL